MEISIKGGGSRAFPYFFYPFLYIYVLNHPEMQRKVEKLRYPPSGSLGLRIIPIPEGGLSANFLSIFTFSGGKKFSLAKTIKHALHHKNMSTTVPVSDHLHHENLVYPLLYKLLSSFKIFSLHFY